jgi:hypothetical protein
LSSVFFYYQELTYSLPAHFSSVFCSLERNDATNITDPDPFRSVPFCRIQVRNFSQGYRPDPTYYIGIIGAAPTPMDNVAESCRFDTDPVRFLFFLRTVPFHVPDPALVPYIPVTLREKMIISLRFQLICMETGWFNLKLFILFSYSDWCKTNAQNSYLWPFCTRNWNQSRNRNLNQDHHGSGSDLGKIILFRKFRSGSGSGSATLLTEVPSTSIRYSYIYICEVRYSYI